MSKKSSTFAFENEDEPTALAYTDFTKPIPILKGKDAERFIKMVEENEAKARERAKKPMTLQEAKNEIAYNKIFMEKALNDAVNYKNRIKELELYIKSING